MSSSLAWRDARLDRLRLSQTASVAAVWLVTRLYLADELGWFGGPKNYQDIIQYQSWASAMVHSHHLPTGASWQYPVGAAWLFLLPHLVNHHYGAVFCLMMFACDLTVTALLVSVAKHGGRYRGVWLWVLLLPALGPLAVMRFDLVPTALVVAALVVLWRGRRIGWFAVLLGVGAMVKVWPLLGLVTATTRRELLRAAARLAATILVIAGLSATYFGNTLGFIANQSTRGLELESIATLPAWARMMVTGKPISFVVGSGARELSSSTAASVASDLRLVMLVLGSLVLAWWISQTRNGRNVPPETAIDALFVTILSYVVVSPVLSPQYLIWLMGVGAFVFCCRGTSMTRPILVVSASVLVTRVLYEHLIYVSGSNGQHLGGAGIVAPSRAVAMLMIVRNLLLLGAAVDAILIVLRGSRDRSRSRLTAPQ